MSKAEKLICVICEGSEEYDYLKRLRDLHVWNDIYQIDLVNANGNGNIPARYQDRFQSGRYDIVLVFMDTDRKPHEQYAEIKQRIDTFHGVSGISDDIVIYGNPCTMQIIILHWEEVRLTSPAKQVNAPIIEKCTGIPHYKARDEQRRQLMELITDENYRIMLQRVSMLPDSDTETPGSNFATFMNYLEQASTEWIEKIERII